MASPTYRRSDLPTTSFVRVELTITFRLNFQRHYCSTDRLIDLNEAGTLFSEETLGFDLCVLRNRDQAFQILDPVLRRHVIPHDSPAFDAIIDDIIQQVRTIGNMESSKGCQVLALQTEIWRTIVQHVNHEEDEDLIGRVLEESASEFEASNFNMVPAKESSVKEMLKRVGVEGGDCDQKGEENIEERLVKGDDCVICLEELKVGSEASQMPCSHTFHSDCIEKWLKQSHYCPVCRFEMPTE
ncbi:E3 ubiquitin-protein ligase rnf8-B-like [Herrania umbratica]|uniref:RING-type E3 ubiquitin transferase n=1 Tax=Herrania umbratica TaxID=108875 RepID=A0A6J1BL95_9ROSI|nr:E3 ubiquitin-protein ligase rnf8-B-like [Herrania umbratica]